MAFMAGLKRKPRTSLLTLSLLIFVSARAEALLFEDAQPSDLLRVPLAAGKRVLWIRDCGSLSRDRDERRVCQEGQDDQFAEGDGRRLDSYLEKSRRVGKLYDEAWLYSDGGVSDEGFMVGRVLRQWQMTVRIPPGASCASACTVAFMGGFFRYVDEGAAYKVHSASGWRNGFDCPKELPDCEGGRVLEALKKSLGDGLGEVSDSELASARYSARRRLVHFQNAFLQPLGKSLAEGEAEDLRLRRLALSRSNPRSAYVRSAQLAEDVRRLRIEGISAAQDILMRIERDSMAEAIGELRAQVTQLGPRAESALRMIEVMFQTSILETAVLSAETLVRMGFVTRDALVPR